MHRGFHMLTLNYLFRLISTTCSNSNNPSAPQEPILCWCCHFLTILTPTFLLTKAWATVKSSPSVHTLSSPDPLSSHRTQRAERMPWRRGRVSSEGPSTVPKSGGVGGICCWGRTDESLPEHCPQPMGATSPRLDPIPETAHMLTGPWAGTKMPLGRIWKNTASSLAIAPHFYLPLPHPATLTPLQVFLPRASPKASYMHISTSKCVSRTKPRATLWPGNPSPGHISGEKHGSERYMYPSVYCSTVYNTQDMEAT